jgi:hypothetical protein
MAVAAAAGPAARRKRSGRRAPERRWAALLAALAVAIFTVQAVFFEVDPANRWGLGWGIAAALALGGVALYAVRRRAVRLVSRRRWGIARAWLAVHLYGGGLFALLMLMHSGFGVPTGTLTWWLWALSLWTVASGVAGRGLQLWLPRVLGSGLEVEAHYERIPELVAEVRAKAERLAAGGDEPIRALYARRMAPSLAAPERRLLFFVDITGGERARFKEFDHLRRFLGAAERDRLDELVRLYETKLQLDAHYTLQQALRMWPWVHVPASVAVLALFALHLVTVLYY